MNAVPYDLHRIRSGISLISPLPHAHLLFRLRLREAGRIDSSEIFWQAIAHSPQRRSLGIYGYFSPQVDELAFIEAIADADSVFYLLEGEHRLFNALKALRTQLQQRGWQHKPLTVSSLSTEAITTPSQSLTNAFLANSSFSLKAPSIAAQIYANAEAETRGILAQIKQLLSQIFTRRYGNPRSASRI